MEKLRSLVLTSYKKLQRTRIKVFAGDEKALQAARLEIYKEFIKNRNVTNIESIQTMVKLAEDVEKELRTRVIQAREVKPGVFEAKITNDTVKLDNIPFDDNAVPIEGIPGKRSCCKNQPQNKTK